MTMRTQNVTALMKNHTFITEDDVDISFMQECKAKEADKGRLKKEFGDDNYNISDGPCNPDTKKRAQEWDARAKRRTLTFPRQNTTRKTSKRHGKQEERENT